MSKEIKVSVIIPVYNVEEYLRECLDSIIKQTLCEIEIICINDGSTDSSPTILDEYKAIDERVLIIAQENRGLSGARNTGIERAQGKYIYFIDSDDMLKQDALYELYELAENETLDILFFDSEVLYEDDDIIAKSGHLTKTFYTRIQDYQRTAKGSDVFSKMMANDEYRSMACMYLTRTAHITENNLRFYEGIYHEDDLYTFLCTINAGRVAHIKKPYYIRRVRANSIMTAARGFRHFHGYLTAFTHILTDSVNGKYADDIQMQINRYLEGIRNALIALYLDVEGSETWLSSLNVTDQYFAGIFVTQSDNSDSSMQRVDALKKELSEVYNSKTWKISSMLQRAYRFFIPARNVKAPGDVE